MGRKKLDIDYVEKMALRTLHPEILRDAKIFASGNVLDGKYDGFERFQIARHNFLYGAMAAKALDKKIKEKAEKRKVDAKNDLEPLSIHGVSGSSFQHLMLDIETMGNESFSSIVSIGAVEFDINTGKTGKEFYTNVDLQSCIDLGLIMNASTVMWWMNQNEQARKDLTERVSLPVIEALKEFSEFCNKDYQIWGNSARFDCGILQNAYNKAGIGIPWDFRKERCVRTLVSFAPEIKVNYKSIGTAHNAVDDCKFQIGYCSEIWRSLNCH